MMISSYDLVLWWILWYDDMLSWWFMIYEVIIWWCDDLMMWWGHDSMIFFDLMIWWCDDLMTWWLFIWPHDDMIMRCHQGVMTWCGMMCSDDMMISQYDVPLLISLEPLFGVPRWCNFTLVVITNSTLWHKPKLGERGARTTKVSDLFPTSLLLA